MPGRSCASPRPMRLQRLAPADIQLAYNSFNRPGPRTRRHIHRILKSALARAVALGALTRKPADAITRLPKVERQPPTTLSVAQAQALLAAIRHTTTYWRSSSPSRQECGAARSGPPLAADRSSARNGERGGELGETKAGFGSSPRRQRPRTVTLPHFARDELRRHQAEQAQTLAEFGTRQTGETLVARGKMGAKATRIADARVHLLGRPKRCATSSVPRPPAQPRHPASHAGVHPKIVQERLGHSTIAVTMDIYSHVSETMQGDAAQRLNSAWAPPVGDEVGTIRPLAKNWRRLSD